MPTPIIDARPIQPGEIGVSVVFFFDPSTLRKIGLDNHDDLNTMISALVTDQFGLARVRLEETIADYVEIDQKRIDATRS